jgi:F420-dependent oxidoreductase-like protein
MRIGVLVTLISGGKPAGIDALVAQVEQIEAEGFDGAWFAHISGIDALTAIAIAGRAVPRLELGTAVTPIYIHHPAAMAQQALTVQAALGGRLALGIGLSHQAVVESRWGYSFERPAEFMREYLAILQPLLHGEEVSFQGERLRSQGRVDVADAPAPPVLLAALGPRMLRIAGELSDGTITWMVGRRTLESHITPVLTEAARAAGRPAPRIVVGLPICVTDDADAARARAARGLARYGELPSYRAMLDREGAAGPGDVVIVGSERDVEQQLRDLESAGATDFNASIFGSAVEQERTRAVLKAAVEHGRGAAV